MIPHLSERALILAPHGRDAMIAAEMLRETGVASLICGGIPQLVAELRSGAGFAVVTEEALVGQDLRALKEWLDQQPEWSDFPFVLLTVRGGGIERNPAATRHLETLGNVTFLERPFHPTTLVSLARAAIRGRRRQYEARARLIALRDLNATLEQRVEEAVAAREAATSQLREAQKLETLGQLTGGLAHDMNNLLMPIIRALDLLDRRYGDSDAAMARAIDRAVQSAERAKTLVSRMLGFARRQTLETRALDLPALLHGMRELIASSVGATIELVIEVPPSLPSVLADANQLELAVLNLCINARDAMPDGGQIVIEAAEAESVPPSLAARPAGYVCVSVSDNGSGMSEATLQRAIEPFFSTKETGKGTGLGLSMVHGFASQSEGAFVLSSQLGGGTRAQLYLPASPQAVESCSQAKRPESTRVSPRTVLLVDDEPLVRMGTADMLEALGHTVVLAADGVEALRELHDNPDIEVVVTDFTMPQMNGAQLAQRIRSERGDLPVLIITGFASQDLDLSLPQLPKPFSEEDLAEAMHRLLLEA